jgi:uncharacterized protein YrrD
MEAMMLTETTSRETRNLIASDRVEGTPVRGTDGTTIGTIERVMIDKLTGNVAYIVLSGDTPSDASNKDFDQGRRERYWGIAETW